MLHDFTQVRFLEQELIVSRTWEGGGCAIANWIELLFVMTKDSRNGQCEGSSAGSCVWALGFQQGALWFWDCRTQRRVLVGTNGSVVVGLDLQLKVMVKLRKSLDLYFKTSKQPTHPTLLTLDCQNPRRQRSESDSRPTVRDNCHHIWLGYFRVGRKQDKRGHVWTLYMFSNRPNRIWFFNWVLDIEERGWEVLQGY